MFFFFRKEQGFSCPLSLLLSLVTPTNFLFHRITQLADFMMKAFSSAFPDCPLSKLQFDYNLYAWWSNWLYRVLCWLDFWHNDGSLHQYNIHIDDDLLICTRTFLLKFFCALIWSNCKSHSSFENQITLCDEFG